MRWHLFSREQIVIYDVRSGHTNWCKPGWNVTACTLIWLDSSIWYDGQRSGPARVNPLRKWKPLEWNSEASSEVVRLLEKVVLSSFSRTVARSLESSTHSSMWYDFADECREERVENRVEWLITDVFYSMDPICDSDEWSRIGSIPIDGRYLELQLVLWLIAENGEDKNIINRDPGSKCVLHVWAEVLSDPHSEPLHSPHFNERKANISMSIPSVDFSVEK